MTKEWQGGMIQKNPPRLAGWIDDFTLLGRDLRSFSPGLSGGNPVVHRLGTPTPD